MIDQIQPSLDFIPPQFNPFVYQASRLILPWWLRQKEAIASVDGYNLKTLAQLYQGFNQGKTRFLIAFRHPSTTDPVAIANLLWRIVPQVAKAEGIALKSPVHAHFMYDRGIPLWAGKATEWLFPRLGATSIQRGKLDREGLKSARHLMINGQFPLAASPEGATNGHNEIIAPLEPGMAQIAFWGVNDLTKAKREEEVFIVPLGIQYHYLTPPWEMVTEVLSQLEQDLGLESSALSSLATVSLPEDFKEHQTLYLRLLRVGEKVLSLMEEFYSKFYAQPLPEIPNLEDPNEKISARLHALLELALTVSEQHFNLKPKGSLIDRCRRLEQAGWNRIYREDYGELSPVEEGLGNWLASEASLYMKHMRIVEKFHTVTGKYVREKPSAERFAETVLLIARLVKLIQGGTDQNLPILGQKTVKMTVGEPLSVSSRWEDYQTSRRQAVETLTQDLQLGLESLIE